MSYNKRNKNAPKNIQLSKEENSKQKLPETKQGGIRTITLKDHTNGINIPTYFLKRYIQKSKEKRMLSKDIKEEDTRKNNPSFGESVQRLFFGRSLGGKKQSKVYDNELRKSENVRSKIIPSQSETAVIEVNRSPHKLGFYDNLQEACKEAYKSGYEDGTSGISMYSGRFDVKSSNERDKGKISSSFYTVQIKKNLHSKSPSEIVNESDIGHMDDLSMFSGENNGEDIQIVKAKGFKFIDPKTGKITKPAGFKLVRETNENGDSVNKIKVNRNAENYKENNEEMSKLRSFDDLNLRF